MVTVPHLDQFEVEEVEGGTEASQDGVEARDQDLFMQKANGHLIAQSLVL